MQLTKIAIGYAGVNVMTIDFPSGKSVTITPLKSYVTADQDEIQFAAQLKFIILLDPNQEEKLNYLYSPENFPHILLDIAKSSPAAGLFKWKADDEEVIRSFLFKLGYNILPNADEGEHLGYDNKETDTLIKLLEGRGYTITKDEEPDDMDMTYELTSKSEVQQVLTENNIIFHKRESKEELKERWINAVTKHS